MNKMYSFKTVKVLAIFIALLSFSLTTNAANIHIGASGGTATNTNFPIVSCYGYNYSQQIILASEYNANGSAGNITAMRFYYDAGGTTLANWQDWVVSIGHTTKTSFASSSDWESHASLTEVYNGTITAVAGNWMEIVFSTPFNYDGTSNILVAIDENTPGYSCSAAWYSYSTGGANRGLVYRNDNTNPDPLTPPNATFVQSTIAQIQFEGVASACPGSSALMSNNITSSSAVLDWTTGGSTNWIVEWDTAGFTQGTGNIVVVAANDSLLLTTLTSQTTYDWYVMDTCSPTAVSAWVGPNSFTTECVAFVAPITESFATSSLPNCWSTYNTSGSLWTFSQGSGVNTQCGAPTENTGDGGYFAWIDQSGTDAGNVLEMNEVDVTALTVPYLDFYHWMCASGYTPINKTFVEAWDGSTWAIVDSIQQGSASWERFGYDLTAFVYNTNFVKIRFRAESGGSGSDYFGDNLLDDISIVEAPNCITPTALVVNDITENSVTLDWTTGGAMDWVVEYGLAGFIPGTGTIVSVTTADSLALTGLMSATNYDWYVRDYCNPDSSDWSASNSFVTNCPTSFAAPYIQNFDDATATPTCWSNPNIGETWKFVTSGGSGPGYGVQGSVDHTSGTGNFTWIDASGNIGANELISPMIDMSALTTPYVGFWLLSNNTTNAFQNNITMYAWNGAAWDSIYNYSGNNANWVEVALNVPAGIPTVTQFKLVQNTGSGTGNAYNNDLLVDDFFVMETPPCPGAPSDLTTSNLTYTSIDLNWMNNGAAVDWIVEWDSAGFTQGAGNVVATTDTFTSLTGLSPNTNYEFYVRDYCGGTDSSFWAGPYPFYTGYCVPAPTSVDNDGITNVTMGTINNNTLDEAGHYGDYTAMITDAGQGGTLNISITLGYNYNLYAWVDWNDDLDFDDAGEEYYLGESATGNPTTLVSSILIPAGATLGNHVIRLGGTDFAWDNNNGAQDPCYSDSWASFEDYTLNVVACPSGITTIDTAFCLGGSLTLSDGSVVDTSGTVTDTLTTIIGCDSALVYNVTVLMPSFDTISTEICQGTPYSLPGGTMVTATGAYDEVFVNAVGCDSTVTFNVTVNAATAFDTAIHLCDGASFMLPSGTSVTDANSYVITETNTAGCDSVITFTITTGMSSTDIINVAICDGDSTMLSDGSYVSTAGVTTIMSTNAEGCDHSDVYNVTVMPASTGMLSDTICAGDTYMFGTQMITMAGSYDETFTSANGCDSVVTLTLEVKASSASSMDETICDGGSYMFAGNVLTMGGTYMDTLVAANGCDSVVTLTLTVNPTYNTVLNESICMGDTFTFNGIDYMTSDTVTVNGMTTNGCDSIVTLELTVNEAMDETQTASICSGDTYTFGTQMLTTAGTYNEMFTNNTGCMYNVELTLTVNNAVSSAVSVELCGDDTYTLSNGTVVSVAGLYTAFATASNGCDSIITYNVSRCVSIFGIENNVAITVFPNPAKDLLNIQFNEKLSNTNNVTIINVLGQNVYSISNTDALSLEINTSNYSDGVYYINVTSDNKTSVKAFTVSK